MFQTISKTPYRLFGQSLIFAFAPCGGFYVNLITLKQIYFSDFFPFVYLLTCLFSYFIKYRVLHGCLFLFSVTIFVVVSHTTSFYLFGGVIQVFINF